ncbi:MAG: hypothetical protein K9M02_10520 [Thiohalocapsa sp.]|nr:hypothetical protein [Thiohalocapsa sp.]
MAKKLRSRSTTIALAAGLLAAAPLAHAFNFGDMFSPGRWMGGDDDYDDYYYGAPYGAYGPYGGAPYGAPGYGGYAPYGAPGYGAVPYGYAPPAAPGYAAPAAPAAPGPAAASGSDDAKDKEIEALKRRIDQLESRQGAGAPPPPPPSAGSGDWPSAPAFRPMDQY